jgi:hypothetical protein
MSMGLSGGACLCEEFHERDFGGGFLYCGTRKMGLLRDMQNALGADLSLYRALLGNLEGVRLLGLLRK